MDWTDLLSLFEELRKRNDEPLAKLLWKARCATDLELYAAYYFPHYCQYAFNEFHNEMFTTIEFMERAIRRARAAPRGYAKSTLTALIKPIHDVCYALEKYIVIVSENTDQANQKLRDIRSEVLTNDLLVADYGICFRVRTPGESQYTVFCGSHSCMFQSFGSSVEVRGIRYGASRPTKIVVDDGENSEEVLNEAIRKKKEDWFFQVISQLGSNTTNIEVIGTILHPESLLANLLKNPAYNSKIYKSIISWADNERLWQEWTDIYTNIDDEDRAIKAERFYVENQEAMLKGTKVLWPEKEPYVWLMKERIEKGNRSFMKEKQNEPIGGEEALFENFHWYKETSDGILIEKTGALLKWEDLKNQEQQWLNMYGVLDPATGQTKARSGRLGDFSCLLSGFKDYKNRLFVHKDWTKRVAPTKYIGQVFDHHGEFDYQKFGVETNLYRNLLLPNMVAERKKRETETKKVIQIPFYDIENVDNKEKRIYTLEPKVTHGWILFNRDLSQEFKSQMQAFPHGDHDDCPDALEMLWGIVNNRYKASAISKDPMGDR